MHVAKDHRASVTESSVLQLCEMRFSQYQTCLSELLDAAAIYPVNKTRWQIQEDLRGSGGQVDVLGVVPTPRNGCSRCVPRSRAADSGIESRFSPCST